MTFEIKKAEKKQCKLRMTICGASGSGKTWSALLLAKGIGGKTVVIDTERGSSNLYDTLHQFDVLELLPPHSPQRFIDAIQQCELAGYEIIIIDSLSHAWAGEGGLLERVDAYATAHPTKNGKNDTWGTGWKMGTPEQNKLVNRILLTNAHLIACMRTKTEWLTEGGKKIKIGLAPVQRDNLEYEFTLSFDIQHPSHLATTSKNRTTLFKENEDVGFIITEETGKKIKEWLNSGTPPAKLTEEQIIEQQQMITFMLEAENEKKLEDMWKDYDKKAKNHPNYPDFRLMLIEAGRKSKERLIQGQVCQKM